MWQLIGGLLLTIAALGSQPTPKPRKRGSVNGLAWGKQLSKLGLVDALLDAAEWIQVDPSWLAAVIRHESRFSPTVVNSRSGATGLIQWMPPTARRGDRALQAAGVAYSRLPSLSAVEQMALVKKDLGRWRGKIHSLEDLYMTIFWPVAVGKPDSYIIQKAGGAVSKANPGAAKAGEDVTKWSASAGPRAQLAKGLQPENVG